MLDTLLSPAFQLVRADGSAANKSAYLADPATISDFRLSNFYVTRSGDILVASFDGTTQETVNGAPTRPPRPHASPSCSRKATSGASSPRPTSTPRQRPTTQRPAVAAQPLPAAARPSPRPRRLPAVRPRPALRGSPALPEGRVTLSVHPDDATPTAPLRLVHGNIGAGEELLRRFPGWATATPTLTVP